MSRTTKTDWIKKGLELLGSEGASALTVDRLTDSLGVTKGSFYHHFENILAFHTGILAAWEADSRVIISEIGPSGSPQITLRALLLEFQKRDPRPEIAIRAWAASDVKAREALTRLDKLRIAFLTKLLTNALGNGTAGRCAAHLLYCAIIGSLCVHPPLKLSLLKQVFEDFFIRYNLSK